MRPRLTLLICILLGCCGGPPPEAYLGNSPYGTRSIGIGRNASGEDCIQRARSNGSGVDVFCGKWQQPSGEVTRLAPGGADRLAGFAASSLWRTALDERFACEPPRSSTVLEQPAQILLCARRVGGWPELAMVTSIDGTIYAADGILPTAPALERSVALLSGRATPEQAQTLPRSGADALLASRLAAQAFRAGDIGQYDDLMAAGSRANLAESFVAAEQAYRAALQLQETALGRHNPNTAVPTMRLALQLSNQGRFPEVDALFARADKLAPLSADSLARAELLHDRGLHMINRERWGEALAMLTEAEAAYATEVPQDALSPLPGLHNASLRPLISTAIPVLRANQESALIGVIESRRNQALALRGLGRNEESAARVRSASALAIAQGLRQPALSARLARTVAATAAASGGTGEALSAYGRSISAFKEALPGSRPVADTTLLRAAQFAARGDPDAALPLCREAVQLLRDLEVGIRIELLEPCLEVYRDQAKRVDEQAMLAEMFEASQLAQGGVTSQQIALATARLAASAKNPKVGEAIRRRQDAGLRLAELHRARDLRAAAARGGTTDLDSGTLPAEADLDAEIQASQATLADADAAVQAAAPDYGQLVQQVAPAPDVLRSLAPGEAFASIILSPTGSWTFVLRDGRIVVSRSDVGEAAMTALVKRVRAGVEEGSEGEKPFDVEAAQSIYAATLGDDETILAGAEQVVVAPTGPLLAIPFGLLLTGPGRQDRLAEAPWLIKRIAVAHVPSPASFVALRKAAAGPRRSQPWFGMGDFKPATRVQAEHTFRSAECVESARLFAGLPSLPLTRRELEAARQLLGGAPQDQLLGAAYTVRAVEQVDLRNYEVIHFAAHALLPSELRCVDEPAIVTSVAAGAPDVTGALLTATEVTGLKLDADLVILSACNTGGPGQTTGGESLSGLARAFFYAGARSMMVTHWSVNDQATAFLVVDTLRHLRSGRTTGGAASLRLAQLDMLAEAGRAMPAAAAHPYYWASFALIGEGRRRLGV